MFPRTDLLPSAGGKKGSIYSCHHIAVKGTGQLFCSSAWIAGSPAPLLTRSVLVCCLSRCRVCWPITMYTLNGIFCDSLYHTRSSTPRLFIVFFFSFLFVCLFLPFDYFKYYFVFRDRWQGQKMNMKPQGDEWNWCTCCEIQKESIKSLKKWAMKQIYHKKCLLFQMSLLFIIYLSFLLFSLSYS